MKSSPLTINFHGAPPTYESFDAPPPYGAPSYGACPLFHSPVDMIVPPSSDSDAALNLFESI